MRKRLQKLQWVLTVALRCLSASVTLLRPKLLAGQINENCLKLQRPVHFKVQQASVCHAVCPGYCGAVVRVMSDVCLRCIGVFLAFFGMLLSLPLAMAYDEMADEKFWEEVGGCESHPGTKLYLEMFPKGRHATEAAGGGVLAVDEGFG